MLITILFAFISGLSAETFVFAESYRTFKRSESFQTNVIWAQKSLAKSVGMFGWGQYGKTYQQTYAGMYLKPTSWLQVGAATGQEQWSRTPRLGSFAYASKSKYYVFAIYENFGATGYWYLILTDAAVKKNWSVGTHSQSFLGHGPRVEYRFRPIGKWIPSIRPAVLWDKRTRPNFIIGLRFSYFNGD